MRASNRASASRKIFGQLARGLIPEAPSALRTICHRPDPQEWPQGVQGEQAHPSRTWMASLMRRSGAGGAIS